MESLVKILGVWRMFGSLVDILDSWRRPFLQFGGYPGVIRRPEGPASDLVSTWWWFLPGLKVPTVSSDSRAPSSPLPLGTAAALGISKTWACHPWQDSLDVLGPLCPLGDVGSELTEQNLPTSPEPRPGLLGLAISRTWGRGKRVSGIKGYIMHVLT